MTRASSSFSIASQQIIHSTCANSWFGKRTRHDSSPATHHGSDVMEPMEAGFGECGASSKSCEEVLPFISRSTSEKSEARSFASGLPSVPSGRTRRLRRPLARLRRLLARLCRLGVSQESRLLLQQQQCSRNTTGSRINMKTLTEDTAAFAEVVARVEGEDPPWLSPNRGGGARDP